MADFTEIIQEIDDEIKTNGKKGIDGKTLNGVLKDMIAAFDALKQDFLHYYTEDVEENIAGINSNGSLTLHGGDRATMSSTSMKVEVTEEGGVNIGEINDPILTIRLGGGAALNGEPIATIEDLPNVYRLLGFKMFSENDQYNIGDYAVKDSLLYKFISSHEGAWNYSDVVVTNLVEILNL